MLTVGIPTSVGMAALLAKSLLIEPKGHEADSTTQGKLWNLRFPSQVFTAVHRSVLGLPN